MARQNGVINSSQASELGASPHFVKWRLDSGDWVRISNGIYASRSAPSTWERQLRAALLTHPKALVGGRSAAYLLGFSGSRPSRPEVLIPYGGNNRSSISRVIRARHFDQVAQTTINGFPCTTVAETILTLSMTNPPASIERMVDDQLANKKLDIRDFDPILDRLAFARQPGLKALRGIVRSRTSDSYQPPTSELERLLYRLLDRPEIPHYERQVSMRFNTVDATVDAFVPQWDLIIESDGRRWHNRQADHDRDRLRDSEALEAGFVVLRLTWSMLRFQPEDCLRRILAIGAKRE